MFQKNYKPMFCDLFFFELKFITSFYLSISEARIPILRRLLRMLYLGFKTCYKHYNDA